MQNVEGSGPFIRLLANQPATAGFVVSGPAVVPDDPPIGCGGEAARDRGLFLDDAGGQA
jgi:hypothetical protein